MKNNPSTTSVTNYAKTEFTSLTKEYVPRQVDETKPFFDNFPFPKEITDVDSSKIVSMKCSPLFDRRHSDNFQYTEGETSKTLEDQEIKNLVTQLEKDWNHVVGTAYIDSIQVCKTQQKEMILNYSLNSSKNREGFSSRYIHYVSSNSIVKLYPIPQSFYCRSILQATKNENNNIDLFYTCSTGDAGYSSASIHKIDLLTGYSTEVYSCNSDIQSNISTCTNKSENQVIN